MNKLRIDGHRDFPFDQYGWVLRCYYRIDDYGIKENHRDGDSGTSHEVSIVAADLIADGRVVAEIRNQYLGLYLPAKAMAEHEAEIEIMLDEDRSL